MVSEIVSGTVSEIVSEIVAEVSYEIFSETVAEIVYGLQYEIVCDEYQRGKLSEMWNSERFRKIQKDSKDFPNLETNGKSESPTEF